MLSLQEECKTCHRYHMCCIDRLYRDFKTGKIISCPCIECIVKPICNLITCPYIIEYIGDRDRNKSILQPFKNTKGASYGS